MAETRPAQGNSAHPTTTDAPAKKSSTRILVLLGILVIAIAAYAHDYFVAAPAAKKAHEDIDKLVDERNAKGVGEASLVTSKDIQELLGKTPSKVDKQDDYTVEVYRYWGGMLPQRQYISVLYIGKDPRHHHVHHLNSMPFEEDFPSSPAVLPDAPADQPEGDKADAPGPAAPGAESNPDDAPAPTEDSPVPEAAPEANPAESNPAEANPEADADSEAKSE